MMLQLRVVGEMTSSSHFIDISSDDKVDNKALTQHDIQTKPELVVNHIQACRHL
jgi:hypothetical protein